MVFGNRGRRLRHRRGVHPQRRHRRERRPTATSCSTPRARTSSPACGSPSRSSALATASPTCTPSCSATCTDLEAHYRDMLDLEFTIEQGRLWMLQARVGKRTGAAALRMAVEMTTDRHIRLTRAEAVARITPEHLDQVLHPRLATAPTCRADHRTGGVARCRGRRGGVHRRRRRGRRGHGRVGDPGAQGDQPRRHPRHARRRRASSPAAAGWSPTPRSWPGAGASRPSSAPTRCGSRARSFSVGDTVVDDGDVISIDGSSGEVVLGAAPLRLPGADPRVRHDPVVGRRSCAGAAWRCGPTPTTAPTRPTPAGSAPRASGCAAPSTCSCARTACRSCAA